MPSHYPNQWWNVANLPLSTKLQWNINPNSSIFIQEYAFEKCHLCKYKGLWEQVVHGQSVTSYQCFTFIPLCCMACNSVLKEYQTANIVLYWIVNIIKEYLPTAYLSLPSWHKSQTKYDNVMTQIWQQHQNRIITVLHVTMYYWWHNYNLCAMQVTVMCLHNITSFSVLLSEFGWEQNQNLHCNENIIS